MPGPTYPALVTNAQEFDWAPPLVGDSVVYLTNNAYAATAIFFGQQVENQILAAIAMSTADKSWQYSYTCLAGLNVGDPVYISSNNTVTLAQSTDTTKNQVVGFVRFKGALQSASAPTATNCYLQNFLIKTGLSGGTAGATCYLTDAGGYSATPGTIATPVGKFKDATTAVLFVSPIPSSSSSSNFGTIILPEVDLTMPATFVFPLPTGYSGINLNECGIILTTKAGTITGQPTIEYGITGTNAKYIAAVTTTLLTAVGKRERYTTLAADDRETVPNFTITGGATGSAAIKGRPYIIGVLS